MNNIDRTEELWDLIEDEMLEEIIFMDRQFSPSHYIPNDSLSDEDTERILLINTCNTLKSDILNYKDLVKKTKSVDTKISCAKLDTWLKELLSLYELELINLGLGTYEYEFIKTK